MRVGIAPKDLGPSVLVKISDSSSLSACDQGYRIFRSLLPHMSPQVNIKIYRGIRYMSKLLI